MPTHADRIANLTADLTRLAKTEHPSEKAMARYLRDHPGAEPKQHVVREEARGKDVPKGLYKGETHKVDIGHLRDSGALKKSMKEFLKGSEWRKHVQTGNLAFSRGMLSVSPELAGKLTRALNKDPKLKPFADELWKKTRGKRGSFTERVAKLTADVRLITADSKPPKPRGTKTPPKGVPVEGKGKYLVYMLDSPAHARDWAFATDDYNRAVSTAKAIKKSYRVVYILEQPGNKYLGSYV